jgi:hypothetical protein
MPDDRAFIDEKVNAWRYVIDGEVLTRVCAYLRIKSAYELSTHKAEDYLLSLRLKSRVQ